METLLYTLVTEVHFRYHANYYHYSPQQLKDLLTIMLLRSKVADIRCQGVGSPPNTDTHLQMKA